MTHKETSGQTTPESTRGGIFFTPRVDIYETQTELTLYADVPGVRSEDVNLRYEQGELVLHGKVQPRRFSIHESINSSRIEAECKNGVLIVHLPKVEAARPKQIQVRG
jgi:HSP20 family protein